MNTTSNGEVAADSFTVFAVEKSADVATHHVDSAPRAVASRSAAQQDGRSVKSSKVPTSRERSKVIPVQEKTEVKRSQSGSPEREPKHKTERSKAREWDFDTTIEVPVDPLSMETLARRPQQADEVHKGPLRSLNPHEPLPWDRLYQQAQVAQAKNEISKAEEKPTRSPEDHEIFRLRNEVHLLRREVAWLQQGESRTQSNGSKVVEKPMRFGLAPKVVREKDKEVCEKATEKAVEKGPTPTKAEILATLRIERERLKMEAQHLRSRSGPAASSPSKKSGGRSTEAKDPISSEKETEQVPESVTDPDPQKDSKLKASTCGMFAKKMARSVTPTRPSRKVESPNKLLKERDASRSVTPSRSAVKKVDAAVKQSSPTRNGAASRSVSPTRLKQDKTVSSKVELPIKRRTPSPSLKDMVAKKMKEGRSGTPVHQAFSKAIAKANEAKKRQLDTLGKQSAEKGRTKSPTRQRSVSPVVTSAQKRSLSPKTTQVSPRTGKPLEATQGTRKVAVQPQIFDRLHQDHAKRMWILEERQALAEETEQKNAKALQGRTVTVASAAEARAAGRRMYADALRSKERLEAKRQEQQDLEALEDLNQRAQKGLRTEGLQAKEPRWEQLHAAAKQKQQRLAEKRLLQELEEEEWMNCHDVHRGLEEHQSIAYERLYQDAMQRGERLFIKEQRKLAEEHQQISKVGVHGQVTLGSDFASRIAEQRSQFLYEDAKQRKERLETKMELEEEMQRSARSTPHLGRSQERSRARSQTPRARVNQPEVPEASGSPIPKAQNMFEVLRPEGSGARKLLQAASRSKMQSAVMSQMVMSRVVQAFGQTRP